MFMSRFFRILAIVVGVLVVIVLVLPFLVPVNQFRPTIEQKASTALGRKVDVGNLSLSLISGSLAADNLSIADDPKFSSSPFLTAKSIKVGVELMPLIFSKTLNITGVSIDTPQVNLIRNPAGDWNYSSFGSSAPKSQGEQKPEAKQPEKQRATQAPNQTSSEEFSVAKLELRNGSVVVGSTNSQKRSRYDQVSVTASDVALTTKFPLTITANLPGGGNFKLDGHAGPLDQSNTALTPVDAKLTVNGLNLATTGFLDPSLGLGGILDLNASLTSQNGEARVNGSGKLSKALLVAGGSPASIPANIDFATRYDLRKNTGVLEPSNLKVGSAVAKLTGTYEVPGDNAIVHIKVDAQNMPAKDLEAFLPAVGVNMPSGATLQGGTLNANLDLSGPTNKLVTAGNVGLFSAKLANFDLGSKLSTVASFAGIHTGKDLDIEKMTTNVRVAPDGLQAQNFDAEVPSVGKLVGNGDIDAKNNLDFKMAATLKGSNATSAANPQSGASQNPQGSASQTPQGGAAGAIGGLLGKVTGGAGGGAGSALSAVGGVLNGCKGTGGPAIPFQVKGTTKDPKFVPDVGGLAAGVLKSQLGCMGASNAQPKGGTQAQQQPGAPNNPVDAITGLFKKKKP
jgi:AsmA protein